MSERWEGEGNRLGRVLSLNYSDGNGKPLGGFNQENSMSCSWFSKGHSDPSMENGWEWSKGRSWETT